MGVRVQLLAPTPVDVGATTRGGIGNQSTRLACEGEKVPAMPFDGEVVDAGHPFEEGLEVCWHMGSSFISLREKPGCFARLMNRIVLTASGEYIR